MAAINKIFDKYKLTFYSGSTLYAVIGCYSGTTYVGKIGFYKDGEPLPTNSGSASSITIYFTQAEFADVMQILWHEKPLYLNLDGVYGSLTTDAEPIGEEEL